MNKKNKLVKELKQLEDAIIEKVFLVADAKGISMQQIANRSYFHRPQVSLLKAKAIKYPKRLATMRTIQRLAFGVGLSTDELIWLSVEKATSQSKPISLTKDKLIILLKKEENIIMRNIFDYIELNKIKHRIVADTGGFSRVQDIIRLKSTYVGTNNELSVIQRLAHGAGKQINWFVNKPK